jgi:predicted transcriptional regulator/transcriptional regulator with XRE-family HTH domain
MARSLIGQKIRERRRVLGITQAKLASTLGISAPYLNLIEANKRNIGGSLLKHLAEQLDLVLEDLDGAAERRLARDLAELAGEPLLAGLQLDPVAADTVAAAHPGWGHALVRLHRAWLDGNRAVSALSDRLNHDPFLGDAVHSLLTQVAAIRSSAEILDGADALTAAQRQRFITIVGAESKRLADGAQALAAFFDKAHTATRSITPVEEVDDFLFDHDNHFPALEQAAADFRVAAAIEGDCSEGALIEHLRRIHGLQVQTRPLAQLDPVQAREPMAFDPAGRTLVEFDPASRTLAVADVAPPATRRFQLARLAVDLFHKGQAVSAVLDGAALLSSDAARRRARRALSSYLAGAVLWPYDAFLDAAERSRYDIDYLAQRFGASFEQVCHRLVTLRRPGAAGIPFGMMRVDPAGFVTKRFPLPQLLLPRHGNACPLWAIYQAFQTPGATVRQLAAFANGDRFLFVARAIEKTRPAFGMPRRFLSLMLGCDALHADRTVYADGLDLTPAAPVTPVGANCRLCPRRECVYREEDPIIDA